MHEVSRFYGIAVEMEKEDTPPAHFHVRYGGAVVLIGIDRLTVLKGRFPARALGLVMEWADLHGTSCGGLGSGGSALRIRARSCRWTSGRCRPRPVVA